MRSTNLRVKIWNELQNCSRLVEMLPCRQEQIFLTCHQQSILLSTEVIVTYRWWCCEFRKRSKTMFISNLFEIKLRKWLGNSTSFSKSGQGFVIPTADVLQGLHEHALSSVWLHFLFLQFCFLLASRQIFVLLACALLLEDEGVGTGQC
jgi:hypothetical protein